MPTCVATGVPAVAGDGLHQAAIRDSLTNAYNCRFFMARLEDEAPRAHRTGTPLSLLMIDIDHFKAINDSHGHAPGDAVPEDIAGVLTQSLRPYDVVARYGGEEFVALMPGADLAQAHAAAERVRTAVQAMRVAWVHDEGTDRAAVSANLGCSCLGGDGDCPLPCSSGPTVRCMQPSAADAIVALPCLRRSFVQLVHAEHDQASGTAT